MLYFFLAKTIDSIFHSTISELNRISATEAVLMFHGVKHSHSYLSQSCTTKLTKKCFSDSILPKNIISLAHEIACNVLAPAFTKYLVKELQSVAYFSICYDISNKRNEKMLPIVAQYFSDFGVKQGIIEFIEQQDESADGLFANIKYVLESHELELEKLCSLGSDNTNVNVGNKHSVFSLFNELIPLLVQGNCYCNILHNSVKHEHDHLLFDIEAAILKIYSHFCRSSVRSLELTKYFDFIDQEQKNTLAEVQEANILLQKHYIIGVNLYSVIKDLLYKLNNRLRDNYFGAKVIELLEKIQDSNELEWRNIERCAAYIDAKKIDKDLLYNDFNHLKSKFIQLKDKFDGIDKQVEEFISSNLHLYKQSGTMPNDEVKLCSGDECDVEAESGSDDEDNIRYHKNLQKNLHIRRDYLWAYLLYGEDVPNFKKLVQFVFSIPASNAFCEIIFNYMKYLWNNNRNRMMHNLVSVE
ncbi:unnamed protein product [Rotaria sordida]|uniref:HAT C-terminal dimerisation domain-containing protein n=1 Tax=Rotaria sordida TaxID=392033 RepID=A0A815I0G7_9BILA|nr:unnamed protein product [Rotaria sordida]